MQAAASRPAKLEKYPALRIYAKLADFVAWAGGALIALGSLVGIFTAHGIGLAGFLAAFLFWVAVKTGADLAQAVLDIADGLRAHELKS